MLGLEPLTAWRGKGEPPGSVTCLLYSDAIVKNSCHCISVGRGVKDLSLHLHLCGPAAPSFVYLLLHSEFSDAFFHLVQPTSNSGLFTVAEDCHLPHPSTKDAAATSQHSEGIQDGENRIPAPDRVRIIAVIAVSPDPCIFLYIEER